MGANLVPGGVGCSRTGSLKGQSLSGLCSPHLGFVLGHTQNKLIVLKSDGV